MSIERVASGRILELNGMVLGSVRGLDRLRRRICPCESSRSSTEKTQAYGRFAAGAQLRGISMRDHVIVFSQTLHVLTSRGSKLYHYMRFVMRIGVCSECERPARGHFQPKLGTC